MAGPIRWSQGHDDGGPTASQVQRYEGFRRARELSDLHLGARRDVQWPAGPLGATGVRPRRRGARDWVAHDLYGVNEHLKMTWQKGEVLSNQEPQRRQGEAGTLAEYLQCGGMVLWAEEQLSRGVALGWLQEWLVEEHGKTSFPADGCRR